MSGQTQPLQHTLALSRIWRKEAAHLVVRATVAPRQCESDRVLGVEVPDLEGIGIGKCGPACDGRGPLSDTGNQPEREGSFVCGLTGEPTLHESLTVTSDVAQGLCPAAVDTHEMHFVVRHPGQHLRSGRREECGGTQSDRFAPFAAHGGPLDRGLAAGDALRQDCGEQVVIRRSGGRYPEAPVPGHGRCDGVMDGDDRVALILVPQQAVAPQGGLLLQRRAGDTDAPVVVLGHPDGTRTVRSDCRTHHPIRTDAHGRVPGPVGKGREGVAEMRASVCDGQRVVVRRLGMADIEVSRPRDGVTVLTMNRPAKLNAMTSGMVEALHAAFDEVSRDRECRVVVLTGEGRGFCAGLDLGGYGNAPGFDWHGRVEQGFAVQRHIASLIPRMRSLPQPVIAAVNGPAAGGGFALVLGSDIRLAAESAKFNAAFIRIGLSACDIGTSWLLPRIVGAARAQELMLTGRIFESAEALRIGLVTEVVPDEALMDAAMSKAAEIMLNAPLGVALTKEGMWTALEIPGLQASIDLENRQQIMASFSEDAAEARRARAEKRLPGYRS